MTPQSAVLYLTHIWTSTHALRFRRLMRETAGIADCYVLFQSTDDDALDRQPTDDAGAVHLFRASELPSRLGYRYLTQKGIVPGCTHFPIIDFAKTHPYKHYWLIEGDVEFSGCWANLIQAGDAVDAGLLATHLRSHSEAPNWYWWTSLRRPFVADASIPNQGGNLLLKAFLCVYRISHDALQLIDRCHRGGWIGHQEVLLPTVIFNAGLGVVDLISMNSFYQETEIDPTADATKLSSVRWRPKVSLFEFIHKFSSNTIYHPVKEEWTYDGTNIVVVRTSEHKHRGLKAVVVAMGIKASAALRKLDVSSFMWGMRQLLNAAALPKRRRTILFQYPDQREGLRKWWLVVAPDAEINVCVVDPEFDVDLYVTTDLRTMKSIWMGLTSVPEAIKAKNMSVTGDRRLAVKMQTWLGLGPFALEKKLVTG